MYIYIYVYIYIHIYIYTYTYTYIYIYVLILQGSIKLSPVAQMSTGFSFWYKKSVMPKKKYITARNLKDCLPSLPLKTRKKKKGNRSFLSDNFELP